MVGKKGDSSKKNDENEGHISALIVDDDSTIRAIHSALLRKHGVRVQSVENGKIAVELYRSGAYFDLVFIDMDMPIMNGVEATRELRGLGVKCKIVGVTSRDSESRRQTFMEAGLDAWFEKPLTVTKLNVFIN